MTQKTFVLNGVEFKVGDKVRIERAIPDHDKDGMGKGVEWMNSWVDDMDDTIGEEATIIEIDKHGAYFKEFGLGYPLSALTNLSAGPATKFKVGDVVICTDGEDYGNFETGAILTVERVKGNLLKFDEFGYSGYRDEDFELYGVPVVAAPKLKLPLPIKRLSGSEVVLIAGTEAGMITLVYTDGSAVIENDVDETEAIQRLEDDIWTFNGKSEDSKDVTAAKAKVEAAEAALAAAEEELTAAEAANKPYLV